MRSIGVNLAPWLDKGLLRIHASRPTLQGVEQHLVLMYELVTEYRPSVMVVDPISNLTFDQEDQSLKPTLMRLIDFLKQQGVTAVFTSLSSDVTPNQASTQIGVTSLMDTWLQLSNIEHGGERTRTLQVLKSRGMAHSNQVREFVIGDDGVDLVDVVVAGDRVLTGSARVAFQEQASAAAKVLSQDQAQRQHVLASKRHAVEAQIAALKAELTAASGDVDFATARETHEVEADTQRSESLAQRRSGAQAVRTRKAPG